MSFGELQLKKYGWKEGKGLGREENGISNALRPKLKFDKCGLGKDHSEEFTFHWWDHMYNKAANNLSVTKNAVGKIELVKSEVLNVSTKKSSLKSSTKKNSSSYGNFVKSCVMEGDKIISVVKDSPAGQREKGEEKSLELIKTFSDKELFAMCGGLTAHKGARHGLTMSAKLARLEQQEMAFLHLQSNNTEEAKSKKVKRKQLQEEKAVDFPKEGCENLLQDCKAIKSKKRKRKQLEETNSVDFFIEVSENILTECETIKSKKSKKNKRKHKDAIEEVVICEDIAEVTTINREKKKKRKHQDAVKEDEICEDIAEVATNNIESTECIKLKAKDKKKKKKREKKDKDI